MSKLNYRWSDAVYLEFLPVFHFYLFYYFILQSLIFMIYFLKNGDKWKYNFLFIVRWNFRLLKVLFPYYCWIFKGNDKLGRKINAIRPILALLNPCFKEWKTIKAILFYLLRTWVSAVRLYLFITNIQRISWTLPIIVDA